MTQVAGRERGRDRDGADPRRGRLRRRADRVRPGRARDLRRARDRLRRRRGADRLRAHREDVGHPASRRRARSDDGREVDRRRGSRSPESSARPRSWTRRPTPRSAARTSETRSRRRPRSPCSTSSRKRGSSSAPNAIGDTIRSRMLAWQERWDKIGDVRGLGAMLAIELVSDPATKEPAADLASAVIDEAFRNGLLLIKSGTDGNCIRVLDAARDHGSRAGRGTRRLGRRPRERSRRVTRTLLRET